MDYNVGDYIVFPLHGAGIIEGIIEKEVEGQTVPYFNIVFPYGNLKLIFPVANIEKIGIRPIIDKNNVQKLIDYIKTSEVKESNQAWNKRQAENLNKIRSGDLYSVLDVYKLLSLKELAKPLSAGEKKMLQNAKRVVFSEIHFSTGDGLDAIEEMFANALKG